MQRAAAHRDVLEPGRLHAEPPRVQELEQPLPSCGGPRVAPEIIDDIHIKSELGRYRMRGFSLFKKIPTWDDLTFLPGTLTRFVIEGYREKCETKQKRGNRNSN